jgi:hypothetical protein
MSTQFEPSRANGRMGHLQHHCRALIDRWGQTAKRTASDPAFSFVEMPHARNEWSVALAFRPHNRFMLRFMRTKNVIGMIFNDVVVDVASLRSSFGTGFNINVRISSSNLIQIRPASAPAMPSECWRRRTSSRSLERRIASLTNCSSLSSRNARLSFAQI